MSTLKVATIQDTSGNNSSTPEQVFQGRAKAWVNFEADGTVAIIDDFNVSSITDGGTAIFTVNFTNALANANYTMTGSSHSYSSDYTGIVVSLSARAGNGNSIDTKTTTACKIVTAATTTEVDPVNISVLFFAS